MEMIGISTDCMCDLPADQLAASGVEVMQFYIHTAAGRFLNESEVTPGNIVEYFEAGNAFLRASFPEAEECKAYFEALLARYDQVVHITTSSKIGLSHPNARAALELMGDDAKRVTLIDSGSLSTGLGHMVLLAVSLRDGGSSAAGIVEACSAMRSKISSSFILPDADYLYRVGYTSQGMRSLCELFNLHPVLCVKNGRLALKSFQMGDYGKAVMRYLRGELKRSKRINKGQLFITHAGCPSGFLAKIKARVDELCKFDKVTVTRASAFISSCCGPETVGVLFVNQ